MKNTPLFDTSLSAEERARWIVSQLTVDEKLQCFAGHPAFPRLGLPEYRFGGEAAHGLQARGDQGEAYEPTKTTAFPQPIGMVASWDRELIREAGNVVGTEVRAFYNVHGKTLGTTRWAPTVDLCRDPRWGRNEEGYGEDPFLTGKMAGAYVEGMQDEHNYDGTPVKKGERGDRIRVGNNLKHFYANNVEWRRCYDSFDVSDKVKFDYELEPYRYCIEESHAEGAMTAYNAINHVTGMINPEVQKILKDTWGMKHAVCDGGAFQQVVNFHHDFETHAETFAASVRAGVDNMLDNPTIVGQAAREAWERGLITEEELDKSLRCMFESRIRLGAFDEKDPYDKLTMKDIDTAWAREISKRMAEETNVLLKNEQAFLPLQMEDDIAIIGPCGATWMPDWYGGKPAYQVNLKQGMEELLGRELRYENGLNHILLKVGDQFVGATDEENPRLILVNQRDEAVVLEHTDWGCGCNFLYSEKYGKYVNFNEDGELRLESRVPFKWFIMENLTIVPAEGAKRCKQPQNANMIEFDRYWDDKEGEIQIYGFGARPVYIIDGVLRGSDLESIKNMEGNREGKNMAENYAGQSALPTVFTVEIVKNGLDAARELARKASKIVVALGCNPMINAKEEIDRKSIEMIPYQEKLTEELFKENQNLAVVLMTNYPYAIGWMQQSVPAILMNATGSQDMGRGLAAAILGKSVPAGRVPMTWYLGDEDLVEMTDYDLIHHPRTYRYFDKPVLYPFGYGLSYTNFGYSDLKVQRTKEQGLRIMFTVTNTGAICADEVAQVYLQRIAASETVHPVRRLIGFERVHELLPGEERKVEITVKASDIAIYMERVGQRVVEPGSYRIYVGGNAQDEAIDALLEV